ncbi:helix-turn-helix domain-containing protein [Streptomyces sp. NPDC004237]|uniref:helix-turn-helix domain-containing protein n=1 Tax=Streptomyces sp. NPDC004237 TaxID=3154455 RepID=UPI0033A853C4
MSNTTTDNIRTLHAVPDPEPLAGLTGAPAAIYTELVKLTGDDMATAAELALAAGLGRSTTGKALVTLEEHGLATRTPGGHDGPRRTPDRWRAAPTGQNATADTETGQEPANAEPSVSTSNTPEPSADTANGENDPADEATLDTPDGMDGASGPVGDGAPDAPSPDAGRSEDGASGDQGPHHAQGNDTAGTEATPVAPEDAPGQRPVTPVEASALPGEKTRLAPGALRQMVIDHLSAHPGEAFTATGISRVIEKSSGAIANALDKLANQNIAEQVSDRPRTYRLAAPQTDA